MNERKEDAKMDVKEYVLSLLQKKYTIDKNVDIETFNYVESGFVDSLGILQFIGELEDAFGIEFADEELICPEFKTVGGVIEIIKKKVDENGK